MRARSDTIMYVCCLFAPLKTIKPTHAMNKLNLDTYKDKLQMTMWYINSSVIIE